jgi:DNA-binding transcriptional MerR regulator
MNEKVRYSIGQICADLELSLRTVRYYEELGLLPGIRRRKGGRRTYGADELERLRFIQRLKHLGLTLEEIGQLNRVYAIRGSTRAMMERLRHLLELRLRGIETKIGELRALRTEMTSYLERVDRRINDLRTLEEDRTNGNGRS